MTYIMRPTRRVKIGEFGTTKMPHSEVCMSMRVAGKVMRFKVLSDRTVQLYDADSYREFSFPILPGEAGIYTDDQGMYYYTVG
jgi:hypothetical protein